MSEPLVLYERRSPAAVLTLNRPDKRNALSRALIGQLTEAFHRARDDAAVRCVILTGAGAAFCAWAALVAADLAAPTPIFPVTSTMSGVSGTSALVGSFGIPSSTLPPQPTDPSEQSWDRPAAPRAR